MNSIQAAVGSIVIVINLADVTKPEVTVQTVQAPTISSLGTPPDGNTSSTSLDFPPTSPQRSLSPGASSRSTLLNNQSLPTLEPLFEDDDEDLELIFEDDFSESDISTQNWTHEISFDNGRDGNEVQYYTHAFENTKIHNGNLLIIAKEEWNNSFNFDFETYQEHIRPVSSAHLTTKDKFNFQFGKVCIKAKMPGGRGLWPQMSLLPNYPDHESTAEINVFEFMSISRKKNNQNRLRSGIIYGGKYPNVARAKNRTMLAENEHPAYHFNEYCTAWGPDKITWTVNGRRYGEQSVWHQRLEDGSVLAQPEPFNEPFYLSLKLAVGGNWVSKHSRGATSLPSAMEVDYVKVWQAKQ